jgi:hypothetical protein
MSITLAEDDPVLSLSSLNLIGVHGHAGVGKDTAVEYLNEKYEAVYGESFAAPLKRCAAEAFGIPLLEFNDRELKESPNEYWGVSPRKIAQFVGTELFRYHVHALLGADFDTFWITRLVGRLIGELPPPEGEGYYEVGDTICISDVRFQNEADWIYSNDGWILHIVRPEFEGAVGISGHASEAGIEFSGFNTWLIRNNSTLEVFHQELDKFAQHIGLVPKATVAEVQETNDPFPL